MLVYSPVPERLTVCGLLSELSEIFNVPVSLPLDCGVNSTSITQVAGAVREPVQPLEEIMKLLLLTDALVKFSGVLPVLFAITGSGELVLPWVSAAKLRLLGLTLACG